MTTLPRIPTSLTDRKQSKNKNKTFRNLKAFKLKQQTKIQKKKTPKNVLCTGHRHTYHTHIALIILL